MGDKMVSLIVVRIVVRVLGPFWVSVPWWCRLTSRIFNSNLELFGGIEGQSEGLSSES